MMLVGLTGTVGSGKSTVAELFEDWSAYRVDTDELAREAVEPDRPALSRLREAFGPEIVGEDGRLDRGALRQMAFSEPGARRRLEEILHPAILALLGQRLDSAREAGATVAVVEIPLLFERELAGAFHVTVAVDAPREIRWQRIRATRELDRSEFEAMDEAQWSGERKREAARFVIRNDGTEEELRARARRVWKAILEESPQAAG